MTERSNILLPNDWDPRDHQKPFWSYMQAGGLRAVAVWHRRAGKDSTALNFTATAAHERVGNYWHLLPEYAQARKAVWDSIDKKGRPVVEQVWPRELRARTVDDEMKIVLRGGSTWQVGGSDRYDALVGSNPIGVVFSEYSISNPAAWEFIRPILTENGGWAIFLYTPRGRNHGFELYRMAKDNPDWFAEVLTVEDTGLITPQQIALDRDSGMDEDMIRQEYFCSWAGVQQGSIYGEAMQKARLENRITAVPYDRRFSVNTFWDIGHRDDTSVICHQDPNNGQNRFINAISRPGEDPAFFVQWMRETGYLFGKHYLPHDATATTMASKSNQLGENIRAQLISLGLNAQDIIVVPRTPDVWTGINATRLRMDSGFWDAEKCKDLVDALESYHKKWDETRHTFLKDPVHDWSSHYADAQRQWGQGYQGRQGGGQFTMAGAVPTAARAAPPTARSIGSRRAGY